MTIGIDVSSVFGEMVMCSATSDIVLKKMCYLYVGNYAKVNPDLALLTINFLQRDCKDEDPMIRGLALRSLCSLRVANLVEYLVGPLGSSLKDNNSYVRMVAVIGVLKLYHISAATCIDADFPAMLKHLLLHDPDTQVGSFFSVLFSATSFHPHVVLSHSLAERDEHYCLIRSLQIVWQHYKRYGPWRQATLRKQLGREKL